MKNIIRKILRNDRVGISMVERSKFVLASIGVLQGIINQWSNDDILWHSPIVLEYLDLFSDERRKFLAHQQLAAVYVEFSNKDAETCKAAINEFIDAFSLDARPSTGSYVHHDFAKLMGFLAKQYDCASVYEPFAGKATFAQFLPAQTSYYGQETNSLLYQFAQLRLEILNRDNARVELADSFTSFQSADMVVSEMPWGVMNRERVRSEVFFLDHASKTAEKISVGIYPNGILFGGYKKLLQIRQRLIEQDLIECVISLPAGLYAPTTNVASCIIITNRNKEHKGMVRFLDASSYFEKQKAFVELNVEQLIDTLALSREEDKVSLWVTNEDILSNDASLVYARYMPLTVIEEDTPPVPEGYKVVTLGDIIEKVRGPQRPDAELVPIIRVGDLAETPFEKTLGETLPSLDTYRSGCTFIQERALLVSRIRTLKPTLYTAQCGGVYLNPNVLAYKIKKVAEKDVSLSYVLSELGKEYVRKQLVFEGATIPSLNTNLFLGVRILLPPTLQMQEDEVAKGRQLAFEKGEKEVMGARRIMDAEMRQRAHTLGHPITAIGRLASSIVDYMNEHDGILHAKDTVDRKGETVEEKFEKLLYEYDRADFLRKNLMFAREFGEPQPIILYDFISEYIRRHDLPKFKPTFIEKNRDFRILFAPEDLTTVLDNIFSNIGKYSFPADGFSPENQVAIDIQRCELNDRPAVSLLIMSSGEPLDATLNPEDVFMWGYTSSKEPDHGFGGNQIKMAVEHFRGKVSFLTEANLKDGFITAYRIVLPLISE